MSGSETNRDTADFTACTCSEGEWLYEPDPHAGFIRCTCDRAEVVRLRAALTEIAEQQPITLGMIESNGFVFKDIGREPGNWQHLAFSIYTDLCEVDTIARAALDEDLAARVLAGEADQ